MLRIVSDNEDFSTVDRIEFNRVCLSDAEADALDLGDTSTPNIILVDESHRPYFRYSEELGPEGRPRLKEFQRGPFTLSVANQGNRMDQSLLIFKLQFSGDFYEDSPLVEKTDSGLILASTAQVVTQAVGVLPFVDAFRRDILKEADKADRLLKAAKRQDLGEARARRDMNTINTMSRNFMAIVRPDKVDTSGKLAIGKEAVSDMLAGSLDAGPDFYDGFWDTMSEVFEPAIRYVGEEHALGRTDLESPAFLHT